LILTIDPVPDGRSYSRASRWTIASNQSAEFANDADFIHVLGGFFHGSGYIEHGHRTMFETI
jgi:hypothetical protein